MDWLDTIAHSVATADTAMLFGGRISFLGFTVSMCIMEAYRARQPSPTEWWRCFVICLIWWFGALPLALPPALSPFSCHQEYVIVVSNPGGSSTVAILTGNPIGPLVNLARQLQPHVCVHALLLWARRLGPYTFNISCLRFSMVSDL